MIDTLLSSRWFATLHQLPMFLRVEETGADFARSGQLRRAVPYSGLFPIEKAAVEHARKLRIVGPYGGGDISGIGGSAMGDAAGEGNRTAE